MGHDGPRLVAVWLTKEFVAALTSMELGSGSHDILFTQGKGPDESNKLYCK